MGRVSRALEAWFPSAARDLPWRRRRAPWPTLVSELLLQQTQVIRVAERFPEFMERFPDPASMARSRVESVLRCWRGLGYYRRAHALHAAAGRIVALHGGRVPSDPDELRALPGVGRYTAGAVASLAFGKPEPIVDGNVSRVLSRLADRRGGAADREGTAWCWASADRLVKAAADPGRTNEALMELGATVCTPKSPRCAACPLRSMCAARKAGSQDVVPPPKPGAARRTLVLHALVDLRGGRVAVELRRAGLWKGLLSPPLVEGPTRMATGGLLAASGAATVEAACGEVPFQTTHRDVCFVVHRAEFGVRRDLRRVSLRLLRNQAISAAALRVIEVARQQSAGADRLKA